MDDLLLFTPPKIAHSKIRRFTESVTKEWTKDIHKEV